jgi:hypothetical protein
MLELLHESERQDRRGVMQGQIAASLVLLSRMSLEAVVLAREGIRCIDIDIGHSRQGKT